MRTSIDQLKEFVEKFENFSQWEKSDQADYIAFFLTTVAGKESITASDVQKCFDALNLKNYNRIAAYLSENSNSEAGKYVKKDRGYRLDLRRFDEIKKIVQNEPEKVEVSENLEKLISQVKEPQEKGFLIEASSCFRIQAYRAFIVMIWILTMDHLKRYIFKKCLKKFNQALFKNPDKRVKKIVKLDDFNDLPELKLIEMARSANIISNDVRKILEEKLGIRNSAAHPSGVGITGHKATEFALDLIKNVLLKY